MSGVPDKTVALLLQRMSQLQGDWLVVADENWHAANWPSIGTSAANSTVVISNRFDIAVAAQQAGLNCTFNDFDFSSLQPQSFDGLLYRVSKERATSHYMINQASSLLKPEATLLLGGEKNDGIKTYVKQAGGLFSDRTNAQKQGHCYLVALQLNSIGPDLLNDKQYAQLRPLPIDCDLSLHSKPGIFGWDKIDRGSAFLVEHLPQFLASFQKPPRSMLDLGCGYGYLAHSAIEHGFERIVATDNNAAALLAATENLKAINGIQWDVIAANAGDQVSEQFDTVLCNPPFHSGFAVDGDLSTRFLKNTQRLLKSSGRALFVVNTFIPLEHKAKQYFNNIEVLANNGSFKLVALKSLINR
ncbi:MAG: methyltransferase [Porticoccaceae bacterium]|nr:methyltransferase [Porticoccaceae bacterium]